MIISLVGFAVGVIVGIRIHDYLRAHDEQWRREFWDEDAL